MNFAEVVQAVLGEVKRPDKQDQAERAVNAVVTNFCLRNRYAEDLLEEEWAIDSSTYTQELLISAVATRFRHFKYMKLPGKYRYIHPVHQDQLFVDGAMQKNVYMLAGDTLTVLTNSLASTLLVGYYQYPPVLTGNDTFWLLDRHPMFVVNKAAARLFRLIGDPGSAKSYEDEAKEDGDSIVCDVANSELSLG